jgi:DnaJ-class molecular chaperone
VEHTWYVHEKYVDDLRQLQREGTPIQHNTNRVISDPYAVLHLRPTAPPAIIKAAWRELAKLLHPDHGGNPEEFQRAKEAYEILSKR